MHYEKFQDGTVKCIEDEIPFQVPEGWEWSRLISICNLISDIDHKMPKAVSEGVLFLSAKDLLNDGTINYTDDIKRISEEDFVRLSRKVLPQKGDIIYSRIGACLGKARVVEKDIRFLVSYSCCTIRPIVIDSTFLSIILDGDFALSQAKKGTLSVGVPDLGIANIKQFLIPIAPLEEQIRIDEKLQQSLSYAKKIASKQGNLCATIANIKAKIFDLAIRGKLVPQNPDDEPAAVLLQRIRAEKEGLIKQGKIKRDKKESVIYKGDDNSYYERFADGSEKNIDEDIPFDLPESWKWTRLSAFCPYGDCKKVDTKSISDDAWILDLEDIEKDTGKILKFRCKSERNSISTKHKFSKGQLLYSKLRPYLNKVVIAPNDGYCTSEILPLTFYGKMNPAYIQLFLMSDMFLSYVDMLSYGVKMPRLGTVDGKRAIIAIPPLTEQEQIVEIVHSAFKQIDKISAIIS